MSNTETPKMTDLEQARAAYAAKTERAKQEAQAQVTRDDLIRKEQANRRTEQVRQFVFRIIVQIEDALTEIQRNTQVILNAIEQDGVWRYEQGFTTDTEMRLTAEEDSTFLATLQENSPKTVALFGHDVPVGLRTTIEKVYFEGHDISAHCRYVWIAIQLS